MRHMRKQTSGIRTIRNHFCDNILLHPIRICMIYLNKKENLFCFFFLGVHFKKLVLGDYRILNLHSFHFVDFLFVMQLLPNIVSQM